MRVLGDTAFAAGAVAFVLFTLDLIFRKPKALTVSIEEGSLVEA